MKTYLRHSIRNVIDIKELIALEMLDFEGKYRDYEEAHDFWEVCFVIEGSVTLTLESKTLILNDKELVLIPPNQNHSYYSRNGNENRAFVVCFDSFSPALDAIKSTVFSSHEMQTLCMTRIMEESKATFYTNEKEELAVLPRPRFGGQQALLLQLEYLFIDLIRRMSEDKNTDIVFLGEDSFYADLTKAIQRYLRENLHKKIKLDNLCERFSYSRSFLCKTFKEQTGETLITYLNRLKMEEGKKFLTQTSLSVTDIALKLGFQEVKYFDSQFKKQVGITPLQYRNATVKIEKQSQI